MGGRTCSERLEAGHRPGIDALCYGWGSERAVLLLLVATVVTFPRWLDVSLALVRGHHYAGLQWRVAEPERACAWKTRFVSRAMMGPVP